MSPRRPIFTGVVPTVEEIQHHCQRVRSAGSPNARARSTLVADYQAIANALGVVPEEVETGLDLQRASAALLRAGAEVQAAAARTPRWRQPR